MEDLNSEKIPTRASKYINIFMIYIQATIWLLGIVLFFMVFEIIPIILVVLIAIGIIGVYLIQKSRQQSLTLENPISDGSYSHSQGNM